MKGAEYAQLEAFVAVAERCNFRRAAAHLGLAPSTLSQTVSNLEDRLGVQLFNRTTRSVSLTRGGERLLTQLQPLLAELERAVEAAADLGEGDRGQVRLVCSRAAARLVLARLAVDFHREYPRIEVDITVDDGITNIVESHYDAGVRVGHLLEKDMVALPVTAEWPLHVVAAPAYLQQSGQPESPEDLRNHNCLRMRHTQSGTVFPWRFQRGRRRFDFQPSGNLVVDDEALSLEALLAGEGIGYLLEPDVEAHLSSGDLVSLLTDWTVTMPPFYIYYLRTRHMPQALRQLLDFIKRWRE